MIRNVLLATAALLSSGAAFAAQTPITIVLNNIGGVDPGTNQAKGFQLAADYWSKVLTTSQPITINIDVGYAPLGPNVLGSTGSNRSIRQVNFVESRIAARQSTAFDATLVLPTLLRRSRLST